MKVRELIYQDGTRHIAYKCPGCNMEHVFSPKRHTFNEDFENPTVTPSLLLDNPQHHQTCHSFITNGSIQFCGDSWHSLANKTIELEHYKPEELV